MFQRLCLVAFVLISSIGGGAWSVDRILHHFDGFGRMQIGAWEAFPQSGGEAADIYARARRIKFETIALGRGEGLVFTLWHDDKGKRLRSHCRYQLIGTIPESRFFTLYAIDQDRQPKKVQPGRPSIINSNNALPHNNGDYHIIIAPQAQSGNWLAIDHNNSVEGEEYGLVLTLYDTPIITTTGMNDLDMPILSHIAGGQCD